MSSCKSVGTHLLVKLSTMGHIYSDSIFSPIAVNIIRYFLLAGIAFVLFYVFFPNKFRNNKIQAKFAKGTDFTREIIHSVQSNIVIGLFISLFLFSPLRSFSAIYTNINEQSLLWLPISIVLAMVIHDTYFYWMHRAVHHPRLFKRVHLVHHKSTNPSPWASFSFHFFEAITEALVIPLIICIVPMHPVALIVFGLFGLWMNIYGHLGYEIAPKWFRHSLLFEIMNTSTHHNMHHSKFKGNYGLYFRFWDRLLSTENPNYVQEFDKIQQRRFG